MLPCKRSGLQPSDCHFNKDLHDSLSGTTPVVSSFCLHDITTCDQISQAFPLHILHTASTQWLEVGTVWEWGYIRPCKSMAHFLGSGLRMTWTRHTCNYCRRMLNVSRCIISIWCQNCSAWSQFLNRAKWQFGWCEQFCPLDRINLLISGESDFHSFLFNYRREPQQWQ